MIKKFTFGTPFPTESVVMQLPEASAFPEYLTLSKDQTTLSAALDSDAIVYGLGENVRGINKRGWKYISNCSDDPSHSENKNSLYGAHNFLMIDGDISYGLFIDFPAKVTYDIGFTDLDKMTISVEEANYALYIIEADTLPSIIREFRSLIGQSYIAPKWAFGYQQSRWGYNCEEDIRKVVKGHRDNRLPLDAVYLDIDYMERFKDFTVDEEKFPDFPDFVSDMKEENIHLVPIIDAGVKIEDGYDVYEEGRDHDYFCKDENDEDFVVGVWPGRVHLPDFLNDEARQWFGDKYKFLIDQGIDGFWNDMNEPALFYSEKHLQEVFDKLKEFQDVNLDLYQFFAFKDVVTGIDNNPVDYESFYHNVNGKKIRHDKVHNLYGYYMTRSAAEAFKRIAPDKNILMFSRSSCIGMHRYSGIWTGDNSSWWSHIELIMKMLPSLNMCGFIYTGADTGGFGDQTTEDLMMRFIQISMFTPLMRNHSALGTREQELYQFKDIDSFRNMLGLRYALIPYLYSEYIKAVRENTLMFTPMGIAYPKDPAARHIEDQLVVGESIMIAPVYKQNAVGRYVYLPEDMTLLRFRSADDVDVIPVEQGHQYVNVALNEVLVFVRKDHILPLGPVVQSTADLDYSHFTIYGQSTSPYTMYTNETNTISVTPA